MGGQFSGIYDALHHAGIVKEVLSQRLAGLEATYGGVQKAPADWEYDEQVCIRRDRAPPVDADN